MVPVKAIAKNVIILKQKPALLLLMILLTVAQGGFSQFQPTPVTRSNNRTTVSGKSYYLHEVLKGQTLYGISKEYQVSEEDIKKTNPELNNKAIYPGLVLRIPEKITEPVVPPEIQDTGIEKPCRAKPFPHKSDNFRLAVLLPLNIEQNDTLTYSDTLKADHFRFYEFLEGVYLAIDSLQRRGLNMTLEIFDTERNTETIQKIIDNGRLDEADLIIGPVFPNEIEMISAFAKSKRIPMVSPLSTYDVARENPFAFQVRNKVPRRIELATEYLGSKYNQNILVIGRYAERKTPEFTRFLANLSAQVKDHDPAKKATVKTVYFSEISRTFLSQDSVIGSLDRHLSANGSNYIIIPSENEVFITEVINLVHMESMTRNIHVFGVNQWVFSDLDLGNLYDVNLELASDFEDDNAYIDYTSANVLDFCNKYRTNWNIEPSKYSFQGFDVTFYFANALFQFGRGLTATVPCWTEYLVSPSMLTPFRFQSSDKVSGFRNQAVTIVRYDKDELIRRKVN